MNTVDRFLNYVSFDTTSDEKSNTTPSRAGEMDLIRLLEREMREIGMTGVYADERGYAYGTVPASSGFEDFPSIGLIAHVDTSPAVPGKGISPEMITYSGGDIKLRSGAVTRAADFPFLEKYVGSRLIVTDGTTLLGADDKAGVAEIISACEYLMSHPEIRHGRIPVCFTPDEEIGRGPDHFDLERFAADFAYTVDGGETGEIEYENFNAASLKVTVSGVNIHPGSAKNRMKNAVLIASEFISMLPPAETPAHTEGYEGFYHVSDIAGNETMTVIEGILRDHDAVKLEQKKKRCADIAAYLNSVYGEGTVTAETKDSYRNMKEKILPVMHIVERAERAFRANGVDPVIMPVRGGTDGARLSFMGLPCPNLSAGGFNFHGVNELIPVDALDKMRDVLVTLVSID